MRFSELHRLEKLQDALALLPVGLGSECKGPMLKGWPDHPGFTTEQLQNFPGIRSVGARTGALTGPLLAFDFDGETSIEYACSKGLDPRSVTTWQVHRDNDPFRLKVLYRPTPDQIARLSHLGGTPEFQGKTITASKEGERKGEALEVFCAGARQVIICGEHPSSGGNYFWPEGLGPEVFSAPSDDWMEYAIEVATATTNRIRTGAKQSTTRQGTRKLNPCPICGRHSGSGGSSLWCAETSDGLILCMPGSSFSAEQKQGPLVVGQIINGLAFVKRTPIPEGDVLTFKAHQPLGSARTRNCRARRSSRLWGRC